MASGAYTSGMKELMDTIAFLSATIKVMLLATATPYTYDPDHDVADAAGANDPVDAELNVTGYTRGWGGAGRKTLASKTFTINDTNNRVELNAANPTWTALGAGQTIASAILCKEGGANDTTTQLLVFLDPTDTPTNGSDITLQFASNGFLNLNT